VPGAQLLPQRAKPCARVALMALGMVKYNPVTNSIRHFPDKRIGVLRSLQGGFERIAQHPILILPPLLLDLFLWLGPRMKVEALVRRFLGLIDETFLPVDPQGGIAAQMEAVKTLLAGFGERFNLLTSLSSVPIGVPSLMKSRMPLGSPLGASQTMEVSSAGSVILLWLAFSALGIALGALYHGIIARLDLPPGERRAFGPLCGKFLLFSVAVYMVVGALMAAMIITVSIAGLLSSALSVIFTVLGFSLIFWVALFFVFTPHGIARYGLGLFRAVVESVQLVRWNVRSTVWFITLAFVIVWLTGQVWFLPEDDSWFSLLAILGHAFVVTTLFAASYVFYQSRREWLVRLQSSLLEAIQSRNPPAEGRDDLD
jgi:hypothetical protein